MQVCYNGYTHYIMKYCFAIHLQVVSIVKYEYVQSQFLLQELYTVNNIIDVVCMGLLL